MVARFLLLVGLLQHWYLQQVSGNTQQESTTSWCSSSGKEDGNFTLPAATTCILTQSVQLNDNNKLRITGTNPVIIDDKTVLTSSSSAFSSNSIISGNKETNLFHLKIDNSLLELTDVILKDGYQTKPRRGGAILIRGGNTVVVLKRVIIFGCRSTYGGGGLYSSGQGSKIILIIKSKYMNVSLISQSNPSSFPSFFNQFFFISFFLFFKFIKN